LYKSIKFCVRDRSFTFVVLADPDFFFLLRSSSRYSVKYHDRVAVLVLGFPSFLRLAPFLFSLSAACAVSVSVFSSYAVSTFVVSDLRRFGVSVFCGSRRFGVLLSAACAVSVSCGPAAMLFWSGSALLVSR
jgi:hypothetical protein